MTSVRLCDRCGAVARDPRVEGWVNHLVTKQHGPGVDMNDLARNNELCGICREEYEVWFRHPVVDRTPAGLK